MTTPHLSDAARRVEDRIAAAVAAAPPLPDDVAARIRELVAPRLVATELTRRVA